MDVFTLAGKLTFEGVEAVKRQLDGLDKKLKTTGQSMTNMGKNMSLKLTAPIVALGAASFKMAGDFDQAFRRVNVMLRATEAESANYKKRILEISDATGQSATDVADAFYQIVSAGFRGADAIDILDKAIRGAVGGAADAAATTAALTKAMNVFSLQGAPGATKVMDSFFGIVDSGLISFEELSKSFPRAASNAQGLRVSISETGAAMATLTQVAGSTEMAATAVDAMFRVMINPSEELLNLYHQWGVETGPEAIEAFGGLTGVLEKVREATNGEVTAIQKLFQSDEAMKGALPLLTALWGNYNNAVNTVANSQGRANDAFNEMAQGPGFQWEQMLTRLKNATVELGDSIADVLGPVLRDTTQKIKDVVSWFKDLSPAMRENIIRLTGLVAAAGPALVMFGQMSLAASALIKMLAFLRIALHITTISAVAMTTAITSGLALVAIGATLLIQNWDRVAPVFQSWAETTVHAIGWVWERIILFGRSVVETVAMVMRAFAQFVNFFSHDVAMTIYNTANKMTYAVTKFALTSTNALRGFEFASGQVADSVQKDFSKQGEALQDWASNYNHTTQNVATEFNNTVGEMAKVAQEKLSAVEQAYWGVVSALGQGASAASAMYYQKGSYATEAQWRAAIREKGFVYTGTGWLPSGQAASQGISETSVGYTSSYASNPSNWYQHGGPIDEPTLLYGLLSRRPYAIAGERGKEYVTPDKPTNRVLAPLQLLLDGRVLADAVLEIIGDKVRLQGGF